MFRYDGPIVGFFMKLGDMIILHVVWLICCIPVITAGPATAAAHYVALKLVKDEGGSVLRLFFKAFLKNFRQGVILGLVSGAAGGLLILDLYLCVNRMEGSGAFKLALLSALLFLGLMYLVTMLYLWPVLVRFEDRVPRVIANSFLIAVSHWGDTSVLLAQDVALALGAFLSFLFLPQAAVVFAILGLPLFFVINAFRVGRVLDGYGQRGVREKEEIG